jgi:hypothetical protein
LLSFEIVEEKGFSLVGVFFDNSATLEIQKRNPSNPGHPCKTGFEFTGYRVLGYWLLKTTTENGNFPVTR